MHTIFSPVRTCFQITPGLCSIIKVEEVSDPLAEAPEKVAEALILFCQVRDLFYFLILFVYLDYFV